MERLAILMARSRSKEWIDTDSDENKGFYISLLNVVISINIEAFDIIIHKVSLSLKPLQLVSTSVTATKKQIIVTSHCV